MRFPTALNILAVVYSSFRISCCFHSRRINQNGSSAYTPFFFFFFRCLFFINYVKTQSSFLRKNCSHATQNDWRIFNEKDIFKIKAVFLKFFFSFRILFIIFFFKKKVKGKWKYSEHDEEMTGMLLSDTIFEFTGLDLKMVSWNRKEIVFNDFPIVENSKWDRNGRYKGYRLN